MCLAIFRLFSTFPARSAIFSGSFSRPAATWAASLPRSCSVAASMLSRVRARCPARAGLRQAISRSPGKSSLVISARSCSSKRLSCRGPSSCMSFLIAGWRRQVIHAIPSIFFRSLIRAVVIMPRSPTITMVASPNVSRTAVTAAGNAAGSEVFPGNTRIATGCPSGPVSSPYSTWARPRLPSREYPRAASSHLVPSTHEEDRSNMAMPPSRRCRRASCFSMSSWRGNSQSIAAYTSSVDAPATLRSGPRVTSSHQPIVDSLEAGRSTREMTSAYARSRSGPGGPSSAGNPSSRAMACTAAACPCGSDRPTLAPAAAGMNFSPARDRRISSIVSPGSRDRFATVSLRTLPSSRQDRRSRWVS